MTKNHSWKILLFTIILSHIFLAPATAVSPSPKGAPDTYKAMADLRAKDIYPDESVKHYLISKIFPDRTETLAVKLSNVTAGFYGITLKQLGLQYGWEKVDPVSKALFRELGQLKTAEALEMGIDLPKDSRALGMVLVTAIYTSSPEYNFEFTRYTPEETVMRISGADRYYRIAKKLNIEAHLRWPVLLSFFEGIAEQMGIRCAVTMKVNRLEKDGKCDYLARFVMEGQKAR